MDTELIERLWSSLAGFQSSDGTWLQVGRRDFRNAAATVAPSASSREVGLREALSAIIDRAPERDSKWAGMTARDIAIAALATGGEER